MSSGEAPSGYGFWMTRQWERHGIAAVIKWISPRRQKTGITYILD